MGNICNVIPLQETNTDDKANAKALCVDLSGNPIIFEADSAIAQKLSVDLDLIQNLHGYAYPWVGGADKNKLPMTIAELKSVNTAGTWDGNTYTYYNRVFDIKTHDGISVSSIDISGAPSSGAYPNLASPIFTLPVGTYIVTCGTRFRLSKNGTQIADSLSSYTLEVDNASDEYRYSIFPGGSEVEVTVFPMIRVSTDDDTFAPYTNDCPISGRTEAGAKTEGKNICPTGDISATSAIVGNLKAGTYTWSFKVVSSPKYSTSKFGLYDGNGQLITSIRGTNTQDVSLPFTLAEDTDNISLNVINYTAGSDGKYIVDVQIEHGDIATAYVPFKTPNTASLSFGQTIYVCHVDFKTGKVTILWQNVDMGSLSWVYNSAGNRFESNIWGRLFDSDRHQLILPNYTYFDGSPSNAPDKSYTCANNNTAIYIKDSSYNGDATALDSDLDGVTGVYRLATPIELQLSPADLELLEGYNYITADGNINISLVPENVIDYVMGQIISAMGTNESGRTTASRAYSAKEYFYKDGKMYKCLTSIASGATFTVGTNCAETTIFAELTALNA